MYIPKAAHRRLQRKLEGSFRSTVVLEEMELL